LKVALHTMGCRSNFADSVELQVALASAGAAPCSISEDADVYVVNTCTVTDSAEKEVRSLIRSIRKDNPERRIVITGCLATVGSEVFKELSALDSVVPPGQRKNLVASILSPATDAAGDFSTSTGLPKRAQRLTSEDINDPLGPALASPTEKLGSLPMRKRFHLRVQEGCDNFCTFCIIPFTRGKIVSRKSERIFEDLKKLSDLGYEEVVLTGTHLGGYGEDFGSSLIELLKDFAKRKPIKRVRLSSLDPNDITPEFIDLIASEEIFCEHLHLCMQALDDEVLKRMNRRYSLSEGLELLEYARRIIPAASLGTDLITGFPGETSSIFEKQCERFNSSPLSYVHVFPYSERADTAATRLDGEVELQERKRRAGRLRALAEKRYRDFSRSFVGKNVEVILETVRELEDGRMEYRGTSREFIEAKTSLASFSERSPELGRCVQLRVTAFDESGETLQCELFDQEN